MDKGLLKLEKDPKMCIKCHILLVMCFLLRCTEGRKVVDLTHTLDSEAPKWPLGPYLKQDDMMKNTKILWARWEHFWVAINYMEYYEHIGTHIDAPIHTAEGRSTLEQIPAYKLMGPGVVFDIKQKAQQNPDYGLTVADIEEYEAEFGRIPDDAIVVINTGWGLKFPRPDQIFGTEILNDSTTFHYPGYTVEAAKFLLTKRSVLVVGSDTPSVDLGIEHKLKVHVYLQSHEVPLMEYVANLDKIPQNGTTIFLGAPKFRGGTGGPTRALAVIEDDFYVHASSCNICLPFLNLVKSCLLGAFIIAIIRM